VGTCAALLPQGRRSQQTLGRRSTRGRAGGRTADQSLVSFRADTRGTPYLAARAEIRHDLSLLRLFAPLGGGSLESPTRIQAAPAPGWSGHRHNAAARLHPALRRAAPAVRLASAPARRGRLLPRYHGQSGAI